MFGGYAIHVCFVSDLQRRNKQNGSSKLRVKTKAKGCPFFSTFNVQASPTTARTPARNASAPFVVAPPTAAAVLLVEAPVVVDVDVPEEDVEIVDEDGFVVLEMEETEVVDVLGMIRRSQYTFESCDRLQN